MFLIYYVEMYVFIILDIFVVIYIDILLRLMGLIFEKDMVSCL